LCDDARETVSAVLGEFPDVEFRELSILDDEELLAKYVEEIPVVLINERVHNIWRIDPDRLRAALTEATS
jgi:hypothetical protein